MFSEYFFYLATVFHVQRTEHMVWTQYLHNATRAVVLCFCAGSLHCLNAAENVRPDIVEVSTTGQQRDIATTPAAVHVISQSDMPHSWWIGEALNRIPGIYQAQLRGVVDAPAIRMPLSFKNHYLYLQDGVPVQSTVMFNSKAFAYSGATLDPAGLEIIKGPGSALYGSDAMSAVINVLSQPLQSEPILSARVGAGMYGGRSGRVNSSGLIAKDQQLGTTIAYDGEDGWRDHSAWSRLQGNIKHRISFGATTIDTTILATAFESEMTGQLNKATFDNNPTDDGLAASVPLDQATDEATYIRISSAINTPMHNDLWLSITPYARDINNTYMEVYNPATTPIDTEHTATVGSLQRLRWQPHKKTSVIIGSDVDWTRLWFLVEQSRPTTVVNGLNSYQGRHYDFTVDSLIIAPYIQGSQWIGEYILMDVGLRYDFAHYDYVEHLGPTTDPNDLVYRTPSRVDTFGQLSPKAGLTYVINEEQAVFTRYAHGFRLPAADSLYVLGNGQTNFSLKPETVDAFEVGWKGRVDAALAWEIDGYWVESRDGIVEDVVTTGGTISTNGGSRRYRGLEVSALWELRSDTDVSVAYAQTGHEIIRYRSDGPSAEDGKTPAKAPAHMATIRLTHRPWSPLSLTFEAQWLGSWYLDDANTARTADVWIFNMHASWYINHHWSVDGKIINLLDASYAATAERYSFGDRYRPGQPLTASVGVTWNN